MKEYENCINKSDVTKLAAFLNALMRKLDNLFFVESDGYYNTEDSRSLSLENTSLDGYIDIEHFFQVNQITYNRSIAFSKEYSPKIESLELKELKEMAIFFTKLVLNLTADEILVDEFEIILQKLGGDNEIEKFNYAEVIKFKFEKVNFNYYGYYSTLLVSIITSTKIKFELKVIFRIPEMHCSYKKNEVIYKQDISFSYIGKEEFEKLKSIFNKSEFNFILNEISELRSNNENVKSILQSYYDEELKVQEIIDTSFCRDINNGFKNELKKIENLNTQNTVVKILVDDNKIEFDFSNKYNFNSCMIGIIGRNGSGKTQFLKSIYSALNNHDGKSKYFDKDIVYSYDKGYINFRKVLFYSFGIFDSRCDIEASDELNITDYISSDETRSIFYSYEDKMTDKIVDEILANFLVEILNIDINIESKKNLVKIIIDKFLESSSGQKTFLITAVRLVLDIEDNTFVIIDEPEVGQHPESINFFLVFLNKLLNFYNSKALIATHSPYIIQNIPSQLCLTAKDKYIRIAKFETFGTSHDEIASRIFNTTVSDTLFNDLLNESKLIDLESMYSKGFSSYVTNIIYNKGQK